MIILTGGAGFIGSCILAGLNKRGIDDILVVDHLNHELKKVNLGQKHYREYLEKDVFIERIGNNEISPKVECVIHMGACSSTTLQDESYYVTNNLEYSKTLARWCVNHGARLIYASSAATYGVGSKGYSDEDEVTRTLQPLNFYGKSKQEFDLWVLDNGYDDRFVGLKFFNVFGPNEYHKGEMRSVICKAFPMAVQEGKMRLFQSHRPDYADGEQKRDFIYVKDVVKVVMFFFDSPVISGIYNVGTGKARSWNDLAKALFSALNKKPVIEYIPMPEHIRNQYQYFTEAKMEKIRRVGFKEEFTPLEEAVEDYVSYLKNRVHL